MDLKQFNNEIGQVLNNSDLRSETCWKNRVYRFFKALKEVQKPDMPHQLELF